MGFASGVTLFASLGMLLTAACAPGAQGPGRGSAASSAPKILRMGMTAGEEPNAENGGIAFTNDDPGYIFQPDCVRHRHRNT